MTQRTNRELAAQRAASELGPGQVVHLGPGLPGMVPRYVPRGLGVVFIADNGPVGYGIAVGRESGDPDLVDAGGNPIVLLPGAAVVSQADSLGMVRGGHVDVDVVEALQVSERGDLVARGADVGGLRGPAASVDVVTGAARVLAIMAHTDPQGGPRIVRKCTYPIAAAGCVELIVTDAAVIQVTGHGLVLREVAPGRSVEEVQAATGVPLVAAPDLREIQLTPSHGEAASKVYGSAAEAVADIPDGATVMLDGFGGPGGMAHCLLLALRDQGAKDLTIISNTAGIAQVASFGTPPGYRAMDHSMLVDSGQIRKAVASFPVSPSPSRPTSFELAFRRGEVEMELVPQGTLAERIRAGGYGIAAFYTPTGAGTLIAEGRETRIIDGREQVLEYGLRADYALLRAHAADRLGNLVYKGTSRNFNAVMAPAAGVTIVEVDEIVEPGALDPDAVVTPGVFVQRIVKRPADFRPYERVG